jgi:hypothetical protein
MSSAAPSWIASPRLRRETRVVVVHEHDLPVAQVDVVRHLDERRLRRGHHAERLGKRAAVARDHAEEEIGRPGLVALEDGLGQRIERPALANPVPGQ